MLRRIALLILVVAMVTACASRSDYTYRYQRPVTDGASRVVSVSEPDWTACDHWADSQVLRGAEYNPRVFYGVEKPDGPYGQGLYEYEMRKCLRKRGYPVEFTPRGFDADGGFQRKQE